VIFQAPADIFYGMIDASEVSCACKLLPFFEEHGGQLMIVLLWDAKCSVLFSTSAPFT
jgi:hypothetical protein